jgi:hypothetical protein
VRSIDIEWIKSWAVNSEIEWSDDRVLELSSHRAQQSRVVIVTETVTNPANLVLLANRLINPVDDGEHTLSAEDQSYIFWIREWGIWDDINEAIADEVFGTLLKGYGLAEGTRGVLFETGESRAASVFVLMTMFFGWDAYLVPRSCLFLCHISHDGYVDLRAQDEATLRQLFNRVVAWGALLKQVDAKGV